MEFIAVGERSVYRRELTWPGEHAVSVARFISNTLTDGGESETTRLLKQNIVLLQVDK